MQPLPVQVNGTSGHTWHRPAALRECLLSSSSHRLVLFIRNNARESPPTAAAVTPGRQKSFVNTNPNFHHYWEAPGGTNSLIPNLNKWPTNQLAVRQAISAAINRQLLA